MTEHNAKQIEDIRYTLYVLPLIERLIQIAKDQGLSIIVVAQTGEADFRTSAAIRHDAAKEMKQNYDWWAQGFDKAT